MSAGKKCARGLPCGIFAALLPGSMAEEEEDEDEEEGHKAIDLN